MPSYRVSKSTSTVTATTVSVSVSGGSQPELAIEQHQQGSFVDIPTTAHAPESAYISADDQYAGLRLLAEVSTLQVDPFVVLATHQAVTFDDDEDQGQSTSSLSLPDEPSRATDDVNPIMVVAEPHETRILEDPKPPTVQNLVDQNADSTDKWIMYSADETRPFKCGYEGCGKTYIRKYGLRRHFVTHTGASHFRRYIGTGAINDVQEQSASSLSLSDEPLLSNKPLQAADDANPIMEVAEPHQTGISEVPKRPSGENVADQNTNSTDNWIMSSGNEIRPFKCGYEGCDKRYTTKQVLQRHFVSHSGGSQLRCYTGDCNGIIRYFDKKALARHIYTKHTMKRPYECDICSKQFPRSDILFTHRKNVHSVKDEQNQPQNSDSTDKWITYSGDETRPFRCDYEGCGKTFSSKQNLRKHFVSHIGDSQFRCYTGDCTGAIRFCDSQALARHIRTQHTFIGRSFRCDICTERFLRRCHLKHHKEEMHFIEKEQTTKKEQKSPLKRKRK